MSTVTQLAQLLEPRCLFPVGTLVMMTHPKVRGRMDVVSGARTAMEDLGADADAILSALELAGEELAKAAERVLELAGLTDGMGTVVITGHTADLKAERARLQGDDVISKRITFFVPSVQPNKDGMVALEGAPDGSPIVSGEWHGDVAEALRRIEDGGRERGDPPVLSAALAQVLDELGATDVARTVRDEDRSSAREDERSAGVSRWLPWWTGERKLISDQVFGHSPMYGHFSPRLAMLVRAVWRSQVVREAVDRAKTKAAELRKRRRTHPVPAAPLVVLKSLASAPSDLVPLGDGTILRRGDATLLRASPGVAVEAAKLAIVGTLDLSAFWRLLGWLLEQQHRTYLTTGNAKEAAHIHCDGITALATNVLGYAGKRATEPLRAALDFGSVVGGATATDEGFRGFWTIAGSTKRGPFRITLGGVLQLDAVNFMPKTMKLLAPVASPLRMPKTVGDRRTAARQHAADQALLCVAAERSNNGTRDGARFVFPFDRDRDRRDIAQQCDLYVRKHSDLSARWLDRLQSGDEAPPLPIDAANAGAPVIELVDDHHAALVDPGMVGLLTEQGKRRRKQSERAKAPRKRPSRKQK